MRGFYIALYSPSSVQKLLDFVKTTYTVDNVIPVIIRPFGAAAQVGVPEAYKVAYKLSKPLLIFPELADLKNVLKCDVLYYLSEDGERCDFSQLISSAHHKRVVLAISSGDQEPASRELEGFNMVWLKDVPPGLPSTAITGIIVYEVAKYLKNISNTSTPLS